MGLDARHVEQHRNSHASFLDEVTRLHGSASADNLDAAKSLLQFLTHWLAYHILGSDQLMARQIASVQAGGRPEDAYQADTRINDIHGHNAGDAVLRVWVH